MPQYKACCPVVAPIKNDAAEETVYNAGFVLDRLMTVKISPEYDSPTVYADDQIAEQINIFKSAGVDLGITTVPEDCECIIFGNTYDKTTGKITDKEDDDGSYCGFGFVYCEMINGKNKYKLYWLKKVKFKMPSDDFATKGESVSFKTPTITGTAYATADGEWRIRQTYANAKEAISALKELAKITTTATE